MLLALDSSAGASAALVHNGTVLASWRTAQTTSHAEVLAPAVQRILAEAGLRGAGHPPARADDVRLSGVVVGVGPGPFTGLRVGLVLAHSLAEGWGLPLHGVCSLDSVALRAVEHGIAEEQFLVATDARRREIYAAFYERTSAGSGAGPLLPLGTDPFVTAPAEAFEGPAVGVGVGLYPELLKPARFEEPAAAVDASTWLPDAVELALIAEQALLSEGGETAGAAERSRSGPLRNPLPLYLRESDAKVPKQMQKSSAA